MKKKILFLALCSLIIAFSSCKKDRIPCIRGKGDVVTETRNVVGFNKVVLETEGTVHIRQGEFAIENSGQENILDKIVTEVQGQELRIYSKRCIGNSEPLNYYITLPDIEGLAVSGSGSLISEDTLDCTYLDLTISGSGELDVNAMVSQDATATISGSGNLEFDGVVSGNTKSTISGSGNIDLIGSTVSQNITISGSGNVNSFSMSTDDCHITISGSGDAKVYVNNQLWVTISGSGNVYYKGDPTVEEVEISGSGSLIHE